MWYSDYVECVEWRKYVCWRREVRRAQEQGVGEMPPKGGKRVGAVNVQKRSKMFKNVRKCSKMFKNVPKCSKMFKNVQKRSAIFAFGSSPLASAYCTDVLTALGRHLPIPLLLSPSHLSPPANVLPPFHSFNII